MFYDSILEIYSEITTTNELFQTIYKYEFYETINCDIQPSSQDILKKTFGYTIESLFIVFADEDLKCGTVVGINGEKFKINKKLNWIDYKIYSIVGI